MHTLELIGPRGIIATYSYPGSWEEVTSEQLPLLIALVTRKVPAPPDHADQEEYARAVDAHLRMHVLRHLTNMPDHLFDRLAPDDLVAVTEDEIGVQQASLLPSLDWITQVPMFTTSKLPTLQVGGCTWQGPRDRLARMCVDQWLYADLLYNRFAAGAATDQHLNELMAALYQPAGTRWSSRRIEALATELADLPVATKLAAAANYRGLREWVRLQYPNFSRGKDADPHGGRGLIVRLAGPKFGTTRQVRRAEIHDVFVHVEQCILDADEIKRRQKA